MTAQGRKLTFVSENAINRSIPKADICSGSGEDKAGREMDIRFDFEKGTNSTGSGSQFCAIPAGSTNTWAKLFGPNALASRKPERGLHEKSAELKPERRRHLLLLSHCTEEFVS